MIEISMMLFGFFMFVGVIFHDPISDLIYAFADYLRSKTKGGEKKCKT